jgi:ASPIC and UnbV/FG-GAP-like repeat
VIPLLLLSLIGLQPREFLDVTAEVGLADISATRLCFVDLNRDGYSDLVVDRHRVFLNVARDEAGPRLERRFTELPSDEVGLPEPVDGAPVVFADLDNDGIVDALLTRHVDRLNPKWEDHGRRTAWCKGLGDGRFWPEQPIEAAPPATTSAVAVTDWNLDGRLDVYLGNWYRHYGETYEGFANDLLLQTEAGWERLVPVESGLQVRDDVDEAGRPTYGVLAAHLALPAEAKRPDLLDLNYGRRWNRLWTWLGAEERLLDLGPLVGFDGDEIRHGRYPDWLKERAKTDARFDRADEEPFRANGNTFDAAVGDVDNDGDFDVLITEITHGWAGESSDRSRILFSRLVEAGRLDFTSKSAFSLDRVPPDQNSWNQGDLFSALCDYDQDGFLDVLLSSGDYPDNQRLRVYRNNSGRELLELTSELGIDHDGSLQLSLGDIDGDGALDVAVGQSFFRYTAEMKAGREPSLKILLNRAANGNSLALRLEGDPRKGVNRDALGAIVEIEVGERRLVRQLAPIGGHSGKQMDFIVHFGLATAARVDRLVVRWPGVAEPSVYENLEAGYYRLRQGGQPIGLPLDVSK